MRIPTICELDTLRYLPGKQIFRIKGKSYTLAPSCVTCGEEFLQNTYNPSMYCSRECTPNPMTGKEPVNKGKKLPREVCEKVSQKLIGLLVEEKNGRWLGGLTKLGLCSFKTYGPKFPDGLSRMSEEVPNALELKCGKCNEWFLAKRIYVVNTLARKGIPYCEYCRKDVWRENMSKSTETRPPMTEETKHKISEANSGENCHLWKGGIHTQGFCLFDTYAPQLVPMEEVQRDPNDKRILQVKCTKCGGWFTPTITEVLHRKSSMEKKNRGESRFYCSSECKQSCSIYKQVKYPKDHRPSYGREVQPELREMVLERDGHQCVKCGSKENLHCHHIEGLRWNPLESADMDICITLCKECHEKVHEQDGCTYMDLRCDI